MYICIYSYIINSYITYSNIIYSYITSVLAVYLCLLCVRVLNTFVKHLYQ